MKTCEEDLSTIWSLTANERIMKIQSKHLLRSILHNWTKSNL